MLSHWLRVLRRALKGKSGVFQNDSLDNSAAVHEAIFVTAEERVRVVARGIKDEIFANKHVMDAAITFMGKDNTQLDLDVRTDLKSQAECEAWLSKNTLFSAVRDNKCETSKVTVLLYLPRRH